MTFQERREAMLSTVISLAKWPHCNHDEASNVNDYNKTVMSAMNRGDAPTVMLVERDGELTFQSYTWQMATAELKSSMFLSEQEAHERLDNLKRKFENQEGMPSATDGSKGQWRSAMTARIETLAWLLGELPAGKFSVCECGQRRDGGGTLRTREGDTVCLGCREPVEETDVHEIPVEEYLEDEDAG